VVRHSEQDRVDISLLKFFFTFQPSKQHVYDEGEREKDTDRKQYVQEETKKRIDHSRPTARHYALDLLIRFTISLTSEPGSFCVRLS